MSNLAAPGTGDNEKDELVKKLIEEKNSLLKIISHDIRGPFNRIFALLQLFELDSSDKTPGQKEYIDKMYQAVISGMEMVKNLHDSRAIDQGSITFRAEKFSLKKLIKNTIRGFGITLRLKNMSILHDDEEYDTELVTDRILLGKVLENIISNAIKFSDKNKIIKINTLADSAFVTISVSDQGPGLTDDEIGVLFKKFQKLGPKPTGGESSSGLGLYNSSVFVKMMKGKLLVERNQETGLKVNIVLPLVLAQD